MPACQFIDFFVLMLSPEVFPRLRVRGYNRENVFVPTGSNASAENLSSVDAELPVVSSQTRHDISQIIHEAGFRSAIDSELRPPPLDDSPSKVADVAQNDKLDQQRVSSPVVESPAFGGFSSSPPEVDSSRNQVDGADDGAVDDSMIVMDGSDGKIQDGEQNKDFNTDIDVHIQDEEVPVPDHDDDSQSASLLIYDDGLLAGSTGSPTSYQVPQSFPAPEAASRGQSPRDNAAAEYPPLPTLSSQPDEGASNFVNQSQGTTNAPEPGGDGSWQRAESPNPPNAEPQEPETPTRTIASIGDRSIGSNASSEVPNPFYEKDWASARLRRQAGESQDPETLNDAEVANDSPFDLPSLDDLWASTAPVLPVKSIESPTPKKKRRTLSSPRQLSSSPAFETRLPGAPPEDTNHEESLPQVTVDLTLSSAAESPEGGDEDFAKSQGLPRGPGWVQKNVPKTRRRTRSSTGAATLNSSPPRSATRKRLRGSR